MFSIRVVVVLSFLRAFKMVLVVTYYNFHVFKFSSLV